ncbi:TlpA family protein disulfide reductase [Flavobacterium sp.]|jgi:thiol-disulfide isomerase/thioredoxin|uniref:TlpA family protein disulfide reductase n=1 Tax=Flavobacterium sp. TaxID=239 RepID=UPI0037BEDBA7
MKFRFIVFCILLFFAILLCPLLGHKFYFITVGIINYISIIYLLKYNPFKKAGWLCMFAYPILNNFAFIYASFNDFNGYRGLLSVLICNLSAVFAILTFIKINKVRIVVSYSVLLIVLIVNYDNIYNYYIDKIRPQGVGVVNTKMPIANLEDYNNNSVKFPSNKVIVVDLWTLSCASCIESFPQFEDLKNQYKEDKEVAFFSINIYRNENEKFRSIKYLKNFTFINFYHNTSLFKKLNFNSVPNYIVINKKGEITYLGSLNLGKFETYNNIHEIIKNSK